MTDDEILARAAEIQAARDAATGARLGLTADGELTWDGQVVVHCPEPFPSCRPGACNCDGMQDYWEYSRRKAVTG